MIFDNVPGGAGHAKRIANELKEAFVEANRRVEYPCCGPETSCYECLRNYRNQPYHDALERGIVHDFLKKMLAAASIQVS